MDKRGLDNTIIFEVILAIVVAIVLIIFAVELVTMSKSESIIDSCRLSILANSKLHESLENSATKIAYTKDITVRCPAPTTQIKGESLPEQYRQVAEDMRSCWYKMGEGKLKVFGTDYVQGTLDTKQKGICLICSEFSTQDILDTDKLGTFIETKNFSNSGETYLQYLNSAKSYNNVGLQFFREYDNENFVLAPSIKKDSGYFIVFVRAPVSYFKKYLSQLVLSEGITESQTIMVMPKEDLAKSGSCEKLFWQKAQA
ncbi:MAG: hypothetical protein WC471_00640 [Candidatus Woesearchaeota archaeon]